MYFAKPPGCLPLLIVFEETPAQSKLEQFTGKYLSRNFGEMNVVIEDGTLILQTGNKNFVLYPENRTSFS